MNLLTRGSVLHEKQQNTTLDFLYTALSWPGGNKWPGNLKVQVPDNKVLHFQLWCFKKKKKMGRKGFKKVFTNIELSALFIWKLK